MPIAPHQGIWFCDWFRFGLLRCCCTSRARGGFDHPFRRPAFRVGPLRLHLPRSVVLFYLPLFVWRLALVLVCVLFGGGFVCRVGGCVRRLVLFWSAALRWLSPCAICPGSGRVRRFWLIPPFSAPRVGRRRHRSNEFSAETSLV